MTVVCLEEFSHFNNNIAKYRGSWTLMFKPIMVEFIPNMYMYVYIFCDCLYPTQFVVTYNHCLCPTCCAYNMNIVDLI